VALDAAAMGALIIGSSLVWKNLLAAARAAGLSAGVAQAVLAIILGLPIAAFATDILACSSIIVPPLLEYTY